MKIAALFPGQGSQVVGMGKEFISSNEEAREFAEQADKTLGFSLSKLCLEGPIEELTLTKNAQPAILLTSYISYCIHATEPDVAAGHSLGEYTALVSSGSIKFEDAISLVHKRGRYMQEAVRPGAGKMAALMGITPEKISEMISQIPEGLVEIANFNSSAQTVIAGDALGIDNFMDLCKTNKVKAIALNVSAPFHCSLMKPAADRLAKDLDAIEIVQPKFSVYANISAKTLKSPLEIRESLKKQVYSSVRWNQQMLNMINDEHVRQTIEYGPGGILSKLLKRINKEVERLEVYDFDSLEKTKSLLRNSATTLP